MKNEHDNESLSTDDGYEHGNGFKPCISQILDRYVDTSNPITSQILTTALNSREDNPLKSLLLNAVSTDLQKNLKKNQTMTTVYITQNLELEQLRILENTFPAFRLVHRATDNNPHGFAAAHRKLEWHTLLAKVGYRNDNDYSDFLRNNDYQSYVTDIGGNFPQVLRYDMKHIHNCSPIIDYNDSNRFTNRFTQLQIMSANERFVDQDTNRNYRDIKNILNDSVQNSDTLCMNRFQLCHHTSMFAISLHSIYDMTLSEIARGMINKKIVSLVGSFIYTDEILYKNKGSIAVLGVEWVIEKGDITFHFKNDNSRVYTHNLANYLKLISVPYFYSKNMDRVFFIELLENLNGVQFFRINCQIVQLALPHRMTHHISLPSLRDKYEITYYLHDYINVRRYYDTILSVIGISAPKTFSVDDNETGAHPVGDQFLQLRNLLTCSDVKLQDLDKKILKFSFLADKELTDVMIAFALSCTESKFKPAELFAYARSHSQKIFVGKNVVHRRANFDAILTFNLAYAVYAYVYDFKYRAGVTMHHVIKSINEQRAHGLLTDIMPKESNPGFVSRLKSYFSKQDPNKINGMTIIRVPHDKLLMTFDRKIEGYLFKIFRSNENVSTLRYLPREIQDYCGLRGKEIERIVRDALNIKHNDTPNRALRMFNSLDVVHRFSIDGVVRSFSDNPKNCYFSIHSMLPERLTYVTEHHNYLLIPLTIVDDYLELLLTDYIYICTGLDVDITKFFCLFGRRRDERTDTEDLNVSVENIKNEISQYSDYLRICGDTTKEEELIVPNAPSLSTSVSSDDLETVSSFRSETLTYSHSIDYIHGDLFHSETDYSLCHCVSADFHMSAGIAVDFKNLFGGVEELRASNTRIGETAFLKRGERHIFYLVTKDRYYHKPTLDTLSRSLIHLRYQCLRMKISKLAMPKIACGLDGLEWADVRSLLSEIFLNTNISIQVYIQEHVEKKKQKKISKTPDKERTRTIQTNPEYAADGLSDDTSFLSCEIDIKKKFFDSNYENKTGKFIRIEMPGDGLCCFRSATFNLLNFSIIKKIFEGITVTEQRKADLEVAKNEFASRYGGVATLNALSLAFRHPYRVFTGDTQMQTKYYQESDPNILIYENQHYDSAVRICKDCARDSIRPPTFQLTDKQFFLTDLQVIRSTKCLMCHDFGVDTKSSDYEYRLIHNKSRTHALRYFNNSNLVKDDEWRIVRLAKNERVLNVKFIQHDQWEEDEKPSYYLNGTLYLLTHLDATNRVINDIEIVQSLTNCLVRENINSGVLELHIPANIDITHLLRHDLFDDYRVNIREYNQRRNSRCLMRFFELPETCLINCFVNSMREIKTLWNDTRTQAARYMESYANQIQAIKQHLVLNEAYRLKDTSVNIYDVKEKKYLFKDTVNDTYRSAYMLTHSSDSNNYFAELENYTKDGRLDNELLRECNIDYFLISRNTKCMNEDRMHAIISPYPLITKKLDFGITVVEGVPGSGKTHYILESHDHALNLHDIVLTATKESAEEIRKRVEQVYYPNRDPRQLSHIHRLKYRTMDSALLSVQEYGTNVVKKIFVDEAMMRHIGQILWLAYIMRVNTLVLCGDSKQIGYFNADGLQVKYHSCYDRLKYSLHTLKLSHRMPMDIVSHFNRCHYYNFEVSTASHVRRSVRCHNIKSSGDLVLRPDASTHYLVFTQGEKFLLAQQFEQLNSTNLHTVGEYQGKQSDNIVVIRVNPKTIFVYEQENQHLVALSRHLKTLEYHSVVVDKFYKILQSIEKNLDVINDGMLGGGKLLTQTDRFFPRICTYRQTADFSLLIKPDYVKDLRNEDTTLRNFVQNHGQFSYTSLKPKFNDTTDSTLSEKLIKKDLSEYSNGHVILQSTYDLCYPGSSLDSKRFDDLIFHQNDLNVSGDASFEFSDVYYHTRARDGLTPALRTACPVNFTPSLQQTLKAFNERNGGVPELSGRTYDTTLIDIMWKRFEDTYIVDKKAYEAFRTNEVTINVDSLTEWLNTQPPDVLKILKNDSDYSIYAKNLSEYSYSLKRVAKPPLDHHPHTLNPSPQSIAFQEKFINAVFCPLVRDIKHRFLSVLSRDKILYCDMSPDDFNDIMNYRMPPKHIKNFPHRVEIDFSKYDKSQNKDALLFEAKFLKSFGASDDVVAAWLYMHIQSQLVNHSTRFRANTEYQRKSGDAMTFLGNTVFLMAVIAYTLPIRNACCLFSGDDSYIFSKTPISDERMSETFASVFNLESKLLHYDVPYFCSKFLIAVTPESWLIISDPIKLLTKLGRSDLINRDHAEKYRVSLTDIVKCYNNQFFVDFMNEAIEDRYSFLCPYNFINALFWTISNPVAFHELYFLHEFDDLENPLHLPNLDI